ncbi:MAG: hypothetical protein KDE47_27860 [Caldilineaceae bacterium]|nr:hypothetical protein [Caldilineaceae bacterium]
MFACLLLGAPTVGINTLNLRPQHPTGHRIIWVILSLFVLFWAVLDQWLWQIIALKPGQAKTARSCCFSPTSFVSLTAVPYRAFPLSCCLLN